jgi:5-methyltetrahydropteroyltriglutamate--homocysteine methyltransferase
MVSPFIPGQNLPTTVVGSYPAQPRRTVHSLLDPFHEAVIQAVRAQISAGITIISDGQVRGDMIGSFASHLPGIRGKDVIGRVMPPNHPITVRDTRYARSLHPYVKGILTGPSTLSYGLHLDTTMYRSRDELIPDMAVALSVEARALSAEGVSIVQIDEPILSTGTADLSVAREAIGHIASSVDAPLCLHVCGPLTRIIDDYVRMPVQILDFEGSVDPGNFASLSARDLSNRYIGYGCVDSSRAAVEDVDTIVSRIRAGVEVLGPEPLIPDPDCGLRMLPPDIAFAKLSRLCEAVAIVRAEIAS